MFTSRECEPQRNPFAPVARVTSLAATSAALPSAVMASTQSAGSSPEAAKLFALYAEPKQQMTSSEPARTRPPMQEGRDQQAPAGHLVKSPHGVVQLKTPSVTPLPSRENCKRNEPAVPGMTGIGSSLAVGRFVTTAKQVQSDWGKLTPTDRADRITRAANDELALVGVPKAEQRMADIGQILGEFHAKEWQMVLGKAPFGQPQVTDRQAADMADTIYHEARHAEQSFRIACLLAGQGKPASAIASDLDIKNDVAMAATAKPLAAASREGNEAQAFYDSEFGKGAEHTEQVYHNHRIAMQGRRLAGDAFLRITKDPNATPAQRQAAGDNWLGALKILQEIEQQYRALPHEADALRAGRAVTEMYLE